MLIDRLIFRAKALVVFAALLTSEETFMVRRFRKHINLQNYVLLNFQNWFYEMIFEQSVCFEKILFVSVLDLKGESEFREKEFFV